MCVWWIDVMFVLGGPRQGGGGGDVETARDEMKRFDGRYRCSFVFSLPYFLVLRRRLIVVARTRMFCCLDADC